MHVDLSFSLNGTKAIAADHGYALYGAISRLLPDVHRENGIAVHPVRGRQIGNRQLMLMPWSTLTLRVADGQIASLLLLAGKSLRLGDTSVRVGVPTVNALVPAAAVRSRLVVIKVANIQPESVTAEQFAGAVRRQLDELGVSDEAIVIESLIGGLGVIIPLTPIGVEHHLTACSTANPKGDHSFDADRR